MPVVRGRGRDGHVVAARARPRTTTASPSEIAVNEERFAQAPTFSEYLETVVKNRELWLAMAARADIAPELLERARSFGPGFRLVALSEDWCGDAVNTLPTVARLAEEVGWDLRVLGRDANPDLMDAHLTDGRSRSIPVVIVYDEALLELGWWGPRPGEIQRWVMSEGLAMPSPERYKVIRRWYAQDRGRTTVGEILDIIASAGTSPAGGLADAIGAVE